MSGRYVSRVFESDLSPELKFTAAVLASFADDDGHQIRPSLAHAAHLRGISKRQVQGHVKELVDMTILVVVSEATQWHPTHYRMVLDQLPTRDPYLPPTRQRYLFASRAGPPGDVPVAQDLSEGSTGERCSGVKPTSPLNSGVKPTSPLPGVKPSAPEHCSGVKPTSPDPSVQRSVSTHTYDPRAREDSGVKPTSPLDVSDGSTDPKLPLLGRPSRHPDHEAHAWCGRICVPKFLHRQFRQALGGPVSLRGKRLRVFYAEAFEAIPAARPIGASPVEFWRAEFGAWVKRLTPAQPAAPVAPATRVNVWSEILHRIEAKIPRHEFYTWFRGTTLVEDQGDEIQIAGPEPNADLYVAWIQKHYRDVVSAAIEEVRPGARVEFVAVDAAQRKQA